MRLVSRPRALHIKNIQMPPSPAVGGGEGEGVRETGSVATRARIYGLHGAIVQIMFMKQCTGRPLFSSARCVARTPLRAPVYYVYARALSDIVEVPYLCIA